jgi:hypothetical protein
MNDFRFGNPALAAFIADMYEPMRKPMRTPQPVRMTALQIVKNRREDAAITAALKTQTPTQKFKCNTCEDTGQTMHLVCYGGPVLERMGECTDCKPTPKPAQPESKARDIALSDGHILIDGHIYKIEFRSLGDQSYILRFARWRMKCGWMCSMLSADAAMHISVSSTWLNNPACDLKIIQHVEI